MNFKTLLLCSLFFFGCYLPSNGQSFCPPNVDFEFGSTVNWHFSTGTVTGTATTGPFYTLTPTTVLGANFTLTSGATTDAFGGFPIVAPGGGTYSLKVGHAATGSLAERAIYYVQIPTGTSVYSLIYHYATVLENPLTGHTANQMPRLVVTAYDSLTDSPIACISYTYVASSALPGFFHSSVSSTTGGGADVYYKPWTTGNMKFNGENGRTVALQFTASDCTEGGHFGYGYIDMSCGLFAVSTITCGTSTATLSAPPGYSTYQWLDSATFSTSYGTLATETIAVPSTATTYAVICTPYTGYGCLDTLFTHLVPTALATVPSHDTTICAGASVTISPNATDVSLPLTYSWSPTTGLSCSTCGTVTATPSVTTAYSVTTTDAGGCLHTDVIHVTVFPNPTTITGTGNVCIGSTMTLGDAITGGRWASSSTTVATVGSVSGIVGGVSTGVPTITYSFGSGLCAITATVNVNPLPPVITGIMSVCAGLTTTLADASTPGTWSSSATSTATVGSSTGVVGGILSGNSTITFTASATGCSRSVVVTVNPLPSLPSGATSVCAGVTTALIDGGGGTWSSGSLSVATVITGTGVVTGVATGTALITYTLPTTCMVTIPVTVNTAPLPISGSLSICSGATTVLGDLTTGGTWLSSNTGVATISGSGIVGGGIPGTSSITYTAPGGCQAFATMTVNTLPGPISGPSSLCTGSTATMSDGGIGTWSSSNLAAATITSLTGIVTGVSLPGSADTITYTLSTGCSATTVINVYPLPPPIMGTGTVCESATTTLSDSITYGTWSSSDLSIASIDLVAGTVYGGASSGTATISYIIPPNSCMVTSIVTVNPLPSPIGGPPSPSVCSGSAIGLSDGGGGTWGSSSTAIATVTSSGVVTGSVVTSTTSTLITYTLPTGCSITEGVTVFPPPASITGTFNVCVGQSVFLSDLSGGGTWSASNGHATIAPTLGILGGFSAGIDTITYRVGSCATTAAVTVNSTPGVIGGTPSICAGGTTLLTDAGTGTWTSSSPGVATAGLSTGIISGVASVTSVSTATITYSLGGTCVATTIVTVNPLPPLCTVSGGGSYCSGSTGPSIFCGPTTTGVSYQLFLGAVPVGSAFPGTGGTITFGAVTGAGVYYVVATSISTTCSRTMSGTASVSVNPLPPLHNVTGGGSYCSGGVGDTIRLDGSDLGVTYTLILGGSVVGGPISGTGSAISFGPHATAGTYTVLATNTATGCTSVMSGSAIVSINPLPTPYAIVGGGAYCAGSIGPHIGLSGSSFGVSYRLYDGTSLVGSPVLGTGIALDFGAMTTAGTYTVVATNTSTLCTSNMTGSVVVTINPVPVVSGATAVCAGATTMETASGFTGGTWTSGSTAVASVGATTGLVTGGASSGSSTIITYTASTGCTGTTLITITPSPGPISGFSSVCIGSSTVETDAITGGTWASSSTSTATVGSLSGSVLGVAIGSATITYSLGTGCTVTKTVTVTPALAAISGTAGVCVGASTTLADAATGGTWSSSNTTVASLIPGTGSVVGMSSGTAVITYTLGACTSTMIVSVNGVPALISGPSIVCAGITISETDAATGGVWASGSSAATVNPSSGIVTGATPGTATISYSLGGGCPAITVITVTPAPAPISGASGLCLGATTSLSETTTGGTWGSTSSPAGVTTVTPTGMVTGMAIGTSVISYNLGGCYSVFPMTINPAPGVISGAPVVCVGSFVPYTNPVSSGAWSSSNTLIATVSSGGSVWGASAGTATISYSLGGSCFVTKLITVNPISPITGSTGICVGATASLADGTGGGTWSSSNTTVATVGGTGIIGGILTGTSLITYLTALGCTATTIVSVNTSPSAITGIMSVCVASCTPLADAGSGGTWNSGSSTATVNPAGLVCGVAPGTATITYSLGFGCVATAMITVHTTPSAITGSTQVCAGLSTTLGDVVTGGSWSSNATGTATVNPTTGSVTGILPGTATITYALGTGCFVTTTVTVNPLPTPVAGTEIICTGASSLLSAGISGGVWTSANTTIATAGSVSGAVTGGVPGTTTITYTLPTGCIASAVVTINAAPAPILGITNMCVGSASALTEPSAGVWSSTNTSVATVTGIGLVTGASVGTSTISYLYYGCTATTTVTVNSLPDPITGATSVCVGSTTALIGSPDGGSWSSSNPPVASIDPTAGFLTGVSPGTVLIAYSLGVGCTVTTTITIDSLPQPITGVPQVCFGFTTTLRDASALGIWSSSNTSVAPVSFTGVVAGLSGGPATISYTNGNGCSATRLVTVVVVPSIVGLSTVCAFSSNVNVYDSVAAGTWTSTSVTISSTGLINAYSAGMASVTYTVPLGCFADTSFMVNPAPGPVMGSSRLCVDVTIALSDTSGGGAWSSSNTHIAPVGPTGSVTGSSPGSAVISYSFPTGCMETDTITVYPPPSAISGGANICDGSSAFLSDVVPGGTWSSSNTALADIGLGTGYISGLYPGVVTITYYLGVSCSATKEITVNPLPSVYDVTGGGNYCAGGTGVHVGLSGSVPGVTYVLYRGGSFVVSVAGTGVAEDFGLLTTAGTYTAIATSAATSCINNMSGSATIVVKPTITPSISVVASEDTVCQGTPVTFYATSRNGGSSPAYQWIVNGTDVGASTTSYSYTPANADVINVRLTSDTACASPVDTVSNSVTMAVDAPLPLIVNVSAFPGSAIAPGDAITLTATVVNGSPFLTYQWMANNIAIPGATTATYSNSDFYPGDSLSCYVVSNGICETTGTGYVIFKSQPPGNVGVKQLSLESGLTVLPNPNKGEFTIKGTIGNMAAGNMDDEVSLEITDMLGQEVYKDKVATNNGLINYKISLSNTVANGMYILNVRSGAESSVFHIVIEQ